MLYPQVGNYNITQYHFRTCQVKPYGACAYDTFTSRAAFFNKCVRVDTDKQMKV